MMVRRQDRSSHTAPIPRHRPGGRSGIFRSAKYGCLSASAAEMRSLGLSFSSLPSRSSPSGFRLGSAKYKVWLREKGRECVSVFLSSAVGSVAFACSSEHSPREVCRQVLLGVLVILRRLELGQLRDARPCLLGWGAEQLREKGGGGMRHGKKALCTREDCSAGHPPAR